MQKSRLSMSLALLAALAFNVAVAQEESEDQRAVVPVEDPVVADDAEVIISTSDPLDPDVKVFGTNIPTMEGPNSLVQEEVARYRQEQWEAKHQMQIYVDENGNTIVTNPSNDANMYGGYYYNYGYGYGNYGQYGGGSGSYYNGYNPGYGYDPNQRPDYRPNYRPNYGIDQRPDYRPSRPPLGSPIQPPFTGDRPNPPRPPLGQYPTRPSIPAYPLKPALPPNQSVPSAPLMPAVPLQPSRPMLPPPPPPQPR